MVIYCTITIPRGIIIFIFHTAECYNSIVILIFLFYFSECWYSIIILIYSLSNFYPDFKNITQFEIKLSFIYSQNKENVLLCLGLRLKTCKDLLLSKPVKHITVLGFLFQHVKIYKIYNILLLNL